MSQMTPAIAGKSSLHLQNFPLFLLEFVLAKSTEDIYIISQFDVLVNTLEILLLRRLLWGI